MKERKTNKKKNQENPTEPIKAAELEELSNNFSKAAEVCQEMINQHTAGLSALLTIKGTFEACSLAFSTGDIGKLEEVAKKRTPELSSNIKAIADVFTNEGKLFSELSNALNAITGKEANQYLPENKSSERLQGYV